MLKDTNSTDFLLGVRSALSGEATLPPRLAASACLIRPFHKKSGDPV